MTLLLTGCMGRPGGKNEDGECEPDGGGGGSGDEGYMEGLVADTLHRRQHPFVQDGVEELPGHYLGEAVGQLLH